MLEKILQLPNGARFYRADLHAHTPADPHFHCGDFNLNTEEERQKLAQEYVRFAREVQKLDIIAITDHNSVGWLGYIQQAAVGSGLIVIPGVELGANEGKRQVHFLALFEPDTSPEHIDHFLSSVGLMPANRFHEGSTPTPRLTDLSTRQLTKRIVSAEDGLPGLAIAAHATRKNGLLHELEGEGRVLAYEDPHLIAVEIPGTRRELPEFVRRLVHGEEMNYSYKAVACLNSSDGRGLGQVGKERLAIGEKFTRIKLSQVSIEALRQAFLDFESRIRLEQEQAEVLYPRLLGLMVEKGFLAGKNPAEPFMIHFNPNLNSLIGGRGAGKSSVIDALRFVLELSPRTEASKAQFTASTSYTLPTGAKVTAFYETADGSRYQIERVKGQAAKVICLVNKGGLPAADLLRSAPVEIYSQKEIYEIANQITFQMNLLDTFIAEKLAPLVGQERLTERELTSNRQQILRMEEELAELEQRLTQLPAVRAELQRLEKDVPLEQITQRQTLQGEQQTLRLLADWVAHKQQQLEEIKQKGDAPPPAGAFPHQSQLIQQIEQTVVAGLNQLQSQIETLWATGEAERQTWQQKKEEQEDHYQTLVRHYGQPVNLASYHQLQDKLQTLQMFQTQQSQKKEQLRVLWQVRETLLDNLESVRGQQSALRQQKVTELTHHLQKQLRIALTPAGYRETYRANVWECFKGDRFPKAAAEQLATLELTPRQLVKLVRQAQQEQNPALLHKSCGLTNIVAQKMMSVPEVNLMQLECSAIPDRPDIALLVGDEYRSLTPPEGEAGLSMGQKCTAILSIILVERNTPLIIDQPEDDLDNAFVFTNVVQTLRREKERRQFIVATHNANIPVSGDAELILLMKANAQQGWVEQCGSIDDPQMRRPVENILEGGREAFRLRQAKYG